MKREDKDIPSWLSLSIVTAAIVGRMLVSSIGEKLLFLFHRDRKRNTYFKIQDGIEKKSHVEFCFSFTFQFHPIVSNVQWLLIF